jgi:hypothetical protein
VSLGRLNRGGRAGDELEESEMTPLVARFHLEVEEVSDAEYLS